MGYVYGYRAAELPALAPRLPVFAEQVITAFIVGDFFIYWEHRIMHAVPYLRKNIHSWHHAYTAPFSWAGGVVHPLEDVVVILCQMTFPLLCGHHPLATWAFVALWVLLLVEEHSGHDVTWAPYHWMPFARCPMGGGAAPHDIHHYKVNKNYAFVLCVWDHLFGTFEPVKPSPAAPSSVGAKSD
uniref:Fatty acid hydroxylase domain-containing protein n=1 Tax=Haptolina ericina TaxID=156174 RepID=A0A7S3FAY2_9EUKA